MAGEYFKLLINIVSTFFVANIFTCPYGEVVPGLCNPKDENKPAVCCANYYWNGTVCAECPGGYIGNNCSVSCPPTRYGRGCRQVCDCPNSSCHHIYGCNSNKKCADGYPVDGCNSTKDCPAGFSGDNCSASCIYPLYGVHCKEKCDCSISSCHQIYGCNITTSTTAALTSKKENDRKEKSRNQYAYRIIIISSGILISTTLLFLIGRKIYRSFLLPQFRGDHNSQGDAPAVDDVYAEINPRNSRA